MCVEPAARQSARIRLRGFHSANLECGRDEPIPVHGPETPSDGVHGRGVERSNDTRLELGRISAGHR